MFQTWLVAIFTRRHSFALFCVLLRSFGLSCALSCSFARFCVQPRVERLHLGISEPFLPRNIQSPSAQSLRPYFVQNRPKISPDTLCRARQHWSGRMSVNSNTLSWAHVCPKQAISASICMGRFVFRALSGKRYHHRGPILIRKQHVIAYMPTVMTVPNVAFSITYFPIIFHFLQGEWVFTRLQVKVSLVANPALLCCPSSWLLFGKQVDTRVAFQWPTECF